MIFSSLFQQLIHQISSPEIQTLLSVGGAYENFTSSFIRSFDLDAILKAQIVGVYIEALERVWQALLAFALARFSLSLAIKEVELRTTLVTDFGLKITEKYDDS